MNTFMMKISKHFFHFSINRYCVSSLEIFVGFPLKTVITKIKKSVVLSESRLVVNIINII